jgi:hypothetical protein
LFFFWSSLCKVSSSLILTCSSLSCSSSFIWSQCACSSLLSATWCCQTSLSAMFSSQIFLSSCIACSSVVLIDELSSSISEYIWCVVWTNIKIQVIMHPWHDCDKMRV